MSDKPSLLIVDDERTHLEQFEHKYKYYFDVEMAFSKEKALEIAAEKTFDVFLLDVRLDASDDNNTEGFDVAKEIRQKNSNALIIMMSRWKEESYREPALQAGANDFIRKPFDINQLIEIIAQHMGG